ncbi:MAG: transcriptional repressor LexA [Candidatus Brocadiia bacterium]|jgi:repressor LexA
MAEAQRLTDRQREIFDWIKAFIARNGLPPTVREIGGAFGIKSSSAFELLQALERKGVLRRGNLGARSLVVRGGRGLRRRDSVEVRILGRIVAGAPNLAVEDPSETLVVDERLGRGRDLYALRVDGDSMKDADILDGDVVIIRRQDTADDGDIVVALIDDESTLKRLRIEQGRVRLDPANDRMKPIYVDGQEFRVQGKVVAVHRAL